MMPSAFGLAGVNQHTWTGGWGTVTYWNAYVANTQMYGKGTFIDSRLDNAKQYPGRGEGRLGTQARRDGPDHRQAAGVALLSTRDAGAQGARRAATTPTAAQRGQEVFNGNAKCSTCHVPPIFTEPGYNLHTAEEIGIDELPGQPRPGRALCHHAAAGVVRHAEDSQGRLLPRRPLRHAGRRRRALRSLSQAALSRRSRRTI